MTIADGIFSLPSPDFLFVHPIDVFSDGGTLSTDARGKTTQSTKLGAPDTTTKGYLTAPNESTDRNAGTLRESLDAVCLVNKDFPVKSNAVIRCTHPSLPANLAGTYEVMQVRTNVSHTRLLLHRLTGPWEAHSGA